MDGLLRYRWAPFGDQEEPSDRGIGNGALAPDRCLGRRGGVAHGQGTIRPSLPPAQSGLLIPGHRAAIGPPGSPTGHRGIAKGWVVGRIEFTSSPYHEPRAQSLQEAPEADLTVPASRPQLRLLDRPTPDRYANPEPPLSPRDGEDVRRGPLLYISGDQGDRVLFTRIARRWKNVNVVHANGGREGLRIATQRPFRLVVLDALLPDVDAEIVVSALRNQPSIAATPIVVLTHDGAPGERAKFVGAGANAYVAKPLDVAEIDRTVAMLLEVASWR